MALFDLSKYDLSLVLEKPNDNNVYKLGDKVKGKIELIVKKQFYSKGLTLRLIKESKITTKSKLDNKETTNTKQEFLFNEVLDADNNFKPNNNGLKLCKEWKFQMLISNTNEQGDKTLMQRYFDAFYPAKIVENYYVEVIFELPWPHNNEIIKKNLIVEEKL